MAVINAATATARLFVRWPRPWIGAALALSLFLPAKPSVAQGGHTVVLAKSIALDCEPQRGFFFVEIPGAGMRRIEAMFVAGVLQDRESNNRPGGDEQIWESGARIESPVPAEDLEFSLLIFGRGGEIRFTAPSKVGDDPATGFLGLADDMRAELVRQKDVLRSWQIQLRGQEDSLRRLRADAEIIGNLGRIVEVKERVAKVNEEIVDAERDIENLQKLLKVAKSRMVPANFSRREGQLTKQIAELADAAKSAELSEHGRRGALQQEFQRKIELVELSRTEDLGALQQELIRLRRQRAALEQGAGEEDAPRDEEHPEDYVR